MEIKGSKTDDYEKQTIRGESKDKLTRKRKNVGRNFESKM